MTAPAASALPPELVSRDQWIGWRYEVKNGDTKPSKVPYNLRTGRRADSTKPSDWLSFARATALLTEHYTGLGFVFTGDNITGIDLDDCLTESGDVKKWAAVLLREFSGTYQEISPSGTGIKIWAHGHVPEGEKGLKVYVDKDGGRVPSDKDPACEGSVEIYDKGRYFAVTGRSIASHSVGECLDSKGDNFVTRLYWMLRGKRLPAPPFAPLDGRPVKEGARHDFLLRFAMQYRRRGSDRESMLSVLRQVNASKCQPPKPDSELRDLVRWAFQQVITEVEETSSNGEPPPSAVELKALLEEVIASKSPEAIYSDRFIAALAAAGTPKQFEAKQALKAVFKPADFVIREWERRITVAESAIRKAESNDSPWVVNATGERKSNLANAMTMCIELPLRYNSFSGKSFLTSASPWGSTGEWTDNDDIECAAWCQRKGLEISKLIACDAAESMARSREHYHPVLEYWKGLVWDGDSRLDDWLVRYAGVVDTPFSRAAGAKWLMSACKRVVDVNTPGPRSDHWNQVDYTLVFEGAQGKKKSTALRALCPDWFSDDIGREIGTPDSAIGLQGKLIVEVAELSAIRKSDWETVKAWLVRREDHYRPPYGRRAADFPRQNIFAASTNSDKWLSDETGGRRFWPVKTDGEINVDGLSAVRDQLWAEAFFRFNEGETTFLSEGMEIIAGAEQHERQEMDAWRDLVERWIEQPVESPVMTRTTQTGALEFMRSRPRRVFLGDILRHCLRIQEADWSHGHKTRVTKILRLAGYMSKRESKLADPKRPEYWIPMNKEEREEE